AVGPVTEVAVAQLIAKQGDDPVLRGALGLADGAHTRRILPVSSSCIMPCLSSRALASLASSAAIPASISERMAAMAACSSLALGHRRLNARSAVFCTFGKPDPTRR